MAGRTTLAKASLGSISNHVMQYIKLSSHVTNQIDRIQRNFIWGTTIEKRKIHLVKWDTITNPKKYMWDLGL